MGGRIGISFFFLTSHYTLDLLRVVLDFNPIIISLFGRDLEHFNILFNADILKFKDLLPDQTLYDARISSVVPSNMSDLFELSLFFTKLPDSADFLTMTIVVSTRMENVNFEKIQ